MDYYPLFLDLRARPVLVIGGGYIALEKVRNLLKAGAQITLIAPQILPSLRRFNRRVTLIERAFAFSDLEERFLLVFCATEDTTLNAQISTQCREKRLLCNTVDDPQWCHFIVPSMLRRGALTVAISTAGVSPTLAKQLKQELLATLDVTYTRLTRWLKGYRTRLKSRIPTLEGRKVFWTQFYAQNPLKILREKGEKGLEDLVNG